MPNHFVCKPPYQAKLLNDPSLKKYEALSSILYDGWKGDVLEHDNKFLNSMGPHAKNKELYLREFPKSLTNHAYTLYATVKPGSIPTWDNMIKSFCSKFFFPMKEKKINIVTLHNTKLKPSKKIY